MIGPRTFLGTAQLGGDVPSPPNPFILAVKQFNGFAPSDDGTLVIPVNVPTGTDQLLACFSYITGASGAATVTDLFDATPLTFRGPGALPSDVTEFSQFWSRSNPVAGVHNIQVSVNPNQLYLEIAIFCLAGVNAAVPFGTAAGGNVNPVYPAAGSGFGPFPSSSVFVDVASAVGDLVIDCTQFTSFFAQPPVPVETVGAGQAETWRQENAFSGAPPVMRCAGSQKIATGATTNMSWAFDIGQELRQSGIAVKKL
jgi:hypothetical protein